MLAIRIELLTGRYVATRFNDRNDTEWPPHPARLYSAMVAAWADDDVPDPTLRDALVCFEALGSPKIAASKASRRSPVTFFVPDNDVRVAGDTGRLYDQLGDMAEELAEARREIEEQGTSPQLEKQVAKLLKDRDKVLVKAAADSVKRSAARPAETSSTMVASLAILPDARGKQARSFPTIVPDKPVVHFVWDDAELAGERRQQLETLLHRVTRLGHSSSLVSCELVSDAPKPNLVPGEAGHQQIRVTTTGLLDELEADFAHHQGIEPRSLPSVITPYTLVEQDDVAVCPAPSLGGSWTVLELRGRPLPLAHTLALTIAVRGALQRHGDDPLPEVISGHLDSPDGQPTPPTTRTHLAVIPLAFVGYRHGDGGVRGVALVLPTEATADDRLAVARAIAGWAEAGRGEEMPLKLGRLGETRLQVTDPLTAAATLRRSTWCRPSRLWASATPVALDRFAGPIWHPAPVKHIRAEANAIEGIIRACVFAGLPEPVEIDVLAASPLMGAPNLRSFPVYQSPGRKVRRQTVHARLRFAEPVSGPVLFGAGRFFGYGLCFPVDERASSQHRVASGRGLRA